MRSNQKTAALSVPLCTALLFSGSYISAKYTTMDLSPLTTTLLRYIIALLFLASFLIFSNTSPLRFARKDILKYFLLGLFGIVGYHCLFFISLRYTAVANTAIINSLNPLLTACCAAAFLNERLGAKNYLGVFLAVTGVLILLSGGNFATILRVRFNKGDLLMICATLCWVAYTLLIRSMSHTYSSYTLTLYSMLSGVCCLSVLVLREDMFSQLRTISAASCFSLLYMGIVASGLGYLLFNKSVKRIGPTKTTSVVYSFVPIIVLFLSQLFFREQIVFTNILSIFLIIAALTLAVVDSEKKRIHPS